jgi:uncharacterized membrane protein YphA (DoxX/SURF4 family)
MNIALWVIQALLAAFFFAAGAAHLLMPLTRLKASAPWTEDVGGPLTSTIGFLELLAALGLVLPGITHVATVLTPLAAIGLVLIFLGAIALHVRRGETKVIVMHIAVVALALVVVWGRLGPYTLR